MNTRPEPWPAFVRRVTENATNAQIAKRIDVDGSTVGRWFSVASHQPKAENVIALARAYGVDPVHALMVAGFLEAREVGERVLSGRDVGLGDFTDLELAQEIVRRIEEGEMQDDQRVPEPIPFPGVGRSAHTPEDELAAVAKKKSSDRGEEPSST